PVLPLELPPSESAAWGECRADPLHATSSARVATKLSNRGFENVLLVTSFMPNPSQAEIRPAWYCLDHRTVWQALLQTAQLRTHSLGAEARANLAYYAGFMTASPGGRLKCVLASVRMGERLVPWGNDIGPGSAGSPHSPRA